MFLVTDMAVEYTTEIKKEKTQLKQSCLHEEVSLVSDAERRAKAVVHPITAWLIGLSGSGKSSLAREVERRLFDQNKAVFCLDGDNLRAGLNRDLGFSREDRRENLRRAAEVAKLLNKSGVSVLASFITPFEEERKIIRAIIGEQHFLLVYLDAALEVCERRDPHGLYEKARRGELLEFTGISSPFEIPSSFDLRLETGSETLEQCANRLITVILDKMLLPSL